MINLQPFLAIIRQLYEYFVELELWFYFEYTIWKSHNKKSLMSVGMQKGLKKLGW